MKKYLIYIGILAIGLITGWILFSGPADTESHTHEVSEEVSQMWTCSMHPQIMQPEPGDCPICGMDLIPAETGEGGMNPNQFRMTENALALANIQTTVIGDFENEGIPVTLSGKIVENEEANVVQVSYFPGRIERLNIASKGVVVRKGQLLGYVYSPELFAAQQELLTAAGIKESQPQLYGAVRNKLKLWKLSDRQINEIEASGKVKDNFPIYATVSGTVVEKLVEEGASVTAGQPLLKISNLSTVWANFDLYENQIDRFRKGQPIEVSANAYPDRKFESTVNFIDPVLNSKTRTVNLRVVLKNDEGLFKPGMFVEGRITAVEKRRSKTLSVPATAVMWTGKRSVVYVKISSQENTFELREVELGNKSGDYYEVINGLEQGEEIVTNGTFTIDAAAQLQGKRSMMNSSAGHTDADHKSDLIENQRYEVSAAFKAYIEALYDEYIKVKNALVEDDIDIAAQGAKKLADLIESNKDTKPEKGLGDEDWEKLQVNLISAVDLISGTEDIGKQREHFIVLSENMAEAVQIFGVNKKVYSQFCPMANNDLGAYWLSEEEEIRNPYFGNAMLRCGTVKGIIE